MSATSAVLPSQHYDAGVARGDWQSDSAQRAVLVEFDRIARELVERESAGLLARLRARLSAPDPTPGLYLWGGVGRGKTFLMDVFYEHLPIAQKRRIHFHRFMREVQASLRDLAGTEDPLAVVAENIARDQRVLCLDEFFVSDIGDAMILGGLLKHLFERGVCLVTTSNTPPVNLYREGLQRDRFLPAIALIEAHCRVIEIVSTQDWRLRTLAQARVYHTPLGHGAERALNDCFLRISHGVVRPDRAIRVHDRPIAVERLGRDVVWFAFEALCEGPRAVADYIEIGKGYGTVIVSGLPQFTPQMEDPARRFIELVDEFYDRHVKLVLSGAVPIVDLYDGNRLRAEFARTESRLIEMQSEAYLALEHKP